MKTALSSLLCVLLMHSLCFADIYYDDDQPIDVPGLNTVTWAANEIVHIRGHVNLNLNRLLIIDQGVHVYFDENTAHPDLPSYIHVSGVVQAGVCEFANINHVNNPIIFTRGTATQSSALGLDLSDPYYDDQTTCTFQFCRFENLLNPIDATHLGSRSLNVFDCNFYGALVGIDVFQTTGSFVKVLRSEFSTPGFVGVYSVGIALNSSGLGAQSFEIFNCLFHYVGENNLDLGIAIDGTPGNWSNVAQNNFDGWDSAISLVHAYGERYAIRNNYFVNCHCPIMTVLDVTQYPRFASRCAGNIFYNCYSEEQCAIADSSNHQSGWPITYEDTKHLRYYNGYTGPDDGINDGAVFDVPGVEVYNDRDGSLPDVGMFGGPFAAQDSCYVYMPPTEAPDNIINDGFERGTYHALGEYRIGNNAVVNIPAGTVFFFKENAGIVVDGASTELHVNGTTELPIVFKGLTSELWQGFRCIANSQFVFQHTEIDSAVSGLAIDRGVVDVSAAGLQIKNCDRGISVVQPSVSIHGDIANNCEITNNIVGVEVIQGAVNLSYVDIQRNTHSGVLLISSTGNFDNCNIEYNGDGLSVLSGGIGLSHSGVVNLKCTAIQYNNGPGVGIYDGVLTMQDRLNNPAMGGNGVSQNSWRSQIHIEHGNLLMQNGLNMVSSTWTPYLIWLVDPTNQSNVNGNSWGYYGTGYGQQIIGRLRPIGSFEVSNFTYHDDAAWLLCDNPVNPNMTSCDSLWNDGVHLAKGGLYSQAAVSFRRLIADECSLAGSAADQLSIAWRSSGMSPSQVRDSLLALSGEIDSPEARLALTRNAAVALALADDFEGATIELDSIAGVTSGMDSVSALISAACVQYLAAIHDTSDTVGRNVHYDTLINKITWLISRETSYMVNKPTLRHTPPSPITMAESNIVLQAQAYEGSGEGIRGVFVDYRFRPSGTWTRDTLNPPETQGDSTWGIVVGLDSHGGDFEYRLIAEDTMGRADAWPSHGGYPNLMDTLTHFVSFEPRDSVLEDTAYIYCPGHLTHSITINGGGGVLYIRPSSINVHDTLFVDTGVVLRLNNDKQDPKASLFIDGTPDAPVVITCEGHRWRGISISGGRLQSCNTTICSADTALIFAEDNSGDLPIVQLSKVNFVDEKDIIRFVHLQTAGNDSSYFDSVTVHGVGIEIKGSSPFIERLEIQQSSSGLYLEDTDSLVIRNSIFRDISGACVTVNGNEKSAHVRFENCQFGMNGANSPQLLIESGAFVDLGHGAHNTFEDSTGVMLQADEGSSAFDMERGGNQFMFTRSSSSNRYLSNDGGNNPCYITGNYFYPTTIYDSNFVFHCLEPDVLNHWIYTNLCVENLAQSDVTTAHDSVELGVQTYLHNYLGVAPSDTITEVGLRYRLFPDSVAWHVTRQIKCATDSLYHWWIPVGRMGGLINYIFWVKDAHGRFATSPVGADTTNPDSGATHFLSVEIAADTIRGTDSVTIWVPTTLNHSITVVGDAKLVFLPRPGASNHDVTLGEGVWINVSTDWDTIETDEETGYPLPGELWHSKLYVLGTEQEPLTGLHPIFWTGHPSSLGGGAGLIVLKFVFFGRPVPEA